MEQNQIDDCVSIIAPVWRGIPLAYKKKYAYNIWDQFENNIRSAAYTSSLSVFFDKLCQRLGVQLKRNGLSETLTGLGSGQDRVLLKIFREQAAVVVLTLRVQLENTQQANSIEVAELGDDSI